MRDNTRHVITRVHVFKVGEMWQFRAYVGDVLDHAGRLGCDHASPTVAMLEAARVFPNAAVSRDWALGNDR